MNRLLKKLRGKQKIQKLSSGVEEKEKGKREERFVS